jgi:BlaI family penicillinase repressor
MTRRQITELGELERTVLEILWRHGRASADAVQKALDRPLKDSTVRTVLRRLEAKGLVTHLVKNRAYLYSARESRAAAAARAIQSILDRFCNGSLEEVLLGLLDARELDRRELKRLAAKIAASGKERAPC